VVVIVGGGGPGGLGPAPRALVATAVGGDVTLRWIPAAGSPSSYIIEAGSTPGARDLANFSTGSNATEFHASGIGAGVYHVRVRAVTAAGVSLPSNEAMLVVGGGSCAGAPSGPVGLVASVSGAAVTLNWGAAAGQPTSYVLEAGSSAGASNLVLSDVGNTTTLTATSVAAGTYYVRVRAKNSCGTSSASNEVVVTVH
jgi:predicted phage tail protein